MICKPCNYCEFKYDLPLQIFYDASKIICENCGSTIKDRLSGEILHKNVEPHKHKRGFYFSSIEIFEKARLELLRYNLKFNQNEQPNFHLI